MIVCPVCGTPPSVHRQQRSWWCSCYRLSLWRGRAVSPLGWFFIPRPGGGITLEFRPSGSRSSLTIYAANPAVSSDAISSEVPEALREACMDYFIGIGRVASVLDE